MTPWVRSRASRGFKVWGPNLGFEVWGKGIQGFVFKLGVVFTAELSNLRFGSPAFRILG